MENTRVYQAVIDCTNHDVHTKTRIKSIEKALDHARCVQNKYDRFYFLIRPGIYREKLTIDFPNVCFEGSNRESTIIVWDDHHGKIGTDGMPIGTGNSATFTVNAHGFSARGLTFANDFDYPGNLSVVSGNSA